MRTMKQKEVKAPELGCRTIIHNSTFILGDGSTFILGDGDIEFDAVKRAGGGIKASQELRFPARRGEAILRTGW